MNSRQIIASIIIIVLIVSITYVVFLVIQEPNDNPLDTTPPVVTIIHPNADAELMGSVTINFTASDLNPIVEYEIRIDSIVRAVNLTSFEWDTTLESDGIHSIVCRARDNSSNWGSYSISVTVNNSIEVVNNAPVVTITAPAADAAVSDNVLITTTVVDEDTLDARIYVDDELMSSTGTFLWNTDFWSNGLHTIIANATDSGGLVGSDTIQVTVDNYVALLNFTGTIKVMTYNIEESGANPDWLNVVKEENPDIMILVETGLWDDNSDLILRNSIEDLNDYFINEAPYCAQNIGFSTSGEAILSRFPILDFNQIPIVPLDDLTNYDVTHDFIHAIVSINGTNVHIIGSHLKASSGSTNEDRREWETEGIINYMDNLGDVPIMYMGDLNSFSPFDIGDLAPNGDLGYGPLTMMLVPDDPTYGQYASAVHNFTDVFRTLNPTDPGYSYGHQDPIYTSRIDFMLVNDYFLDKLINSTCGDTAHADTGSDHYSVDVFLGWNSTGLNDTTAPANVTGLQVDATYAMAVDLSWNANNETDLYRYVVYRNSTKIAEVVATFYNDTGLSSNTTYEYEVSAKDFFGNEGNKSLAVLTTTLVMASPDSIVINEILPAPQTIYTDEWIELYNPSGDDVDLTGYILDDITTGGTPPYTIPATTIIPAGGFLIFYLAETGVAQNNAGDTVNLIKPDGVTIQDSYTYTSIIFDASYGRETDGALIWKTFTSPTPGASNNGAALYRTPISSSTGYLFEIFLLMSQRIFWGCLQDTSNKIH